MIAANEFHVVGGVTGFVASGVVKFVVILFIAGLYVLLPTDLCLCLVTVIAEVRVRVVASWVRESICSTFIEELGVLVCVIRHRV